MSRNLFPYYEQNKQRNGHREIQMAAAHWKNRLLHLYTGTSADATYFRFGLVVFDLATLLFFVVS